MGNQTIKNQDLLDRLKAGNEKYIGAKTCDGDVSVEVRKDTAVNGQHPYAIVITCSDSRVIPESIFNAGIGEIFTIRVAGNVVGETQLGSVEYAAGHLGSKMIVVLGHTHCGAVGATLAGGAEGHVKCLTDAILEAIGAEKDEYKACGLNVKKGVEIIENGLADSHEVYLSKVDVIGAIYDIEDGHVDWL